MGEGECVNELCYFFRLIYKAFCYSSEGSPGRGPSLYHVAFTWVPFYSRAFEAGFEWKVPLATRQLVPWWEQKAELSQ